LTEPRTISFVRTLRAAPDQVFDAWTRPEQIALWWDPEGAPLSDCTVELRPGGAFRFVMASTQEFAGVYRTVERPCLLEFDAMGAFGTVSLQARGEATLMTVSIRCASSADLDRFVEMGVDTGTARTLDNLVAYLEGAALAH